jgi:hypothetical protein
MPRVAAARHADPRHREIVKLMRHTDRGGRASKAELLTGIAGASSGPVHKIDQ